MEILKEELQRPSDVLKLKYLPITLSLLLLVLGLPLSVWVATSEPVETRLRAAPTIPPRPTHSVTIDAPKDGDVVPSATVVVSGRTSRGATVVVEAGESVEITESNQAGVFRASVSPGEGPATITVTSFDEGGNEATASVEVVSAKPSR